MGVVFGAVDVDVDFCGAVGRDQRGDLGHEAAHKLLFTNKKYNDLVGKWLVAYPAFVPFSLYRRGHFAHHKEEFGPNEPDLNLYNNYPITRASLRRKLTRDLTGRTGLGVGVFAESELGSGTILQTRVDYLQYPQTNQPQAGASLLTVKAARPAAQFRRTNPRPCRPSATGRRTAYAPSAAGPLGSPRPSR